MTSLPTWLVYLSASLLSLAGALIGTAVGRIGSRELDRRAHREEHMRMLRWSSEFAVAAEPRKARVGVAMLRALKSVITDTDQRRFIAAALDEVIAQSERDVLSSDYDQEAVS